MIKYLGSKRRLVPVLAELCERAGAARALDLFTGTTRVAQAFKATGATVTAARQHPLASTLAACYVATDARAVDTAALERHPGAAQRAARAGRVRDRDVLRAVTFLPAAQR